MWIARDKNENLFLYEEKPYLIEDRYFSDDVTKCYFVAKTAFKNITFENSPKQISIVYEK